jgi:hypothetical protein
VNGSQQRLELLNSESGVADNSAHRKCVHWIMTGNGDDPSAIRHDNVFALPGNSEPGFLECLHSCEVIDAGNSRHS